MAASKKKGKAIQFQIGWAGLIAIVVSCVCVLLWAFVLGFWMGQKVATGNSSEPKVSVYSPSAKLPSAPGPNLSDTQPQNEIQIGPKEDELAKKEFSALKESLKQEATEEEGVKTEVLPGAAPGQGQKETRVVEGKKEAEAVPAAKEEKVKEAKKEEAASAAKKKETRKAPEKKVSKKIKTERIAKSAKEASRPFALQIASYRTLAQAKKEAKRWKKKGYYTRVKSANLGRKGIWYRVYLGRYRSLEEAKRASVRLATKEGLRSYVTKVSR